MRKNFLVVLLFFLVGCKNVTPSSSFASQISFTSKETFLSEKEIINIKGDEFFTQEEASYYVFVYLDGCMACRDVKLILNHLDFPYPLYYLNFIDITYKKGETHDNIGVSLYEDIDFSIVPHLFLIEEKVIQNEWKGSEKIIAFFHSFL